MATKNPSWIGIIRSLAFEVLILLILIYPFVDSVWFRTHIDTILNTSVTFAALARVIEYLSLEE